MYVLNIREIRKICRILENQQNHPVNFHFKLEVQRPAEKPVIRAGFTDFTETLNCKHL